MDLTTAKKEVIQADQLFHLGKNQYFALNFLEAIKNLEKASSQFLQEKQYAKYLKAQTILIAIHTEMEHFDEIDKISNTFTNIIQNHKKIGIHHPRLWYALGLCSIRKKDYAKAQIQFNNALNIALKLHKEGQESNDQEKLFLSKIDICYISYGFTGIYIINNQISEAIQELKNMKKSIKYLKNLIEKNKLKIILTNTTNLCNEYSNTNFSEDILTLELSYMISKANVLSIEQKYQSAEKLYWFCYEKSQKSITKKYLSPHLLSFLGMNYMKKGDYEQAAIFLKLAEKSTNPDIFKRVSRQIIKCMESLKAKTTNDYDIIVSFENKTIIEKQKGYINLKNQFILLDMLKLLIFQQGTVHSKESLVEKIWQQRYNPLVHDNKIYVTIKRLRELLEPDYRNPKYIFRAKEGYYINKKIKALIK